jgi:exodeoxyribonuclease VII small subunit
MNNEKELLSFEKAFEKLEHILETLNSSQPSLEEAIKMYEEADQLILQCHRKLSSAEKKIEVLMKNRSGELQMGDGRKPEVQKFEPQDNK